ncbi:MAG TPA: C39 family peptidase [Anaerolineaceae bacterium]|nr:C39 family peptidase [Anaerolineaceae bacterium]
MRRKRMRLRRALRLIAGVLVLCGLAVLVYQIPYVNYRLSWRLDGVETYVYSLMHPVAGYLPTPLPGATTELASENISVNIPEAPSQPVELAATRSPIIASAVSATTLAQDPTQTPGPLATPLPSPTPLPGRVTLPPPVWEAEDWNDCGPTTLSLYLKFWGWQGNQFTIQKVIKPQRADRNVNIDELTGYVNDNVPNLTADYRVGGTVNLLRQFVANGIPIAIEESLMIPQTYIMNDDHWAGHYILVTGYDDKFQIFFVQDTELGKDHVVPYKELDRDWQSFNRAYLMVYPPDQEQTVKNLLGSDWDRDTNRQHALDTATAETKVDPKNAFAWFNMGSNLVYFGRYNEAAAAYDTARSLGLPQRMLRYQFGPFIAYFNAGRNNDLLALTQYALNVTPNSEEDLLWRGWALYRSGDRVGAVDCFNKALAARPAYGDAIYALKFVQNN